MSRKFMVTLVATGACVAACLGLFVFSLLAGASTPAKPKLPPPVAIVDDWTCQRNSDGAWRIRGRVYNSSNDRTASEIEIDANLLKDGRDVQRRNGVLKYPPSLAPSEQANFVVMFGAETAIERSLTGSYSCKVWIASYKEVP